MKLWILRPCDLDDDDNPWNPWYEKAFGFVVRASTENKARKLADEDAGDENRGCFLGQQTAETTHPWLDPKYSNCVLLTDEGKQGVIMQDFASA